MKKYLSQLYLLNKKIENKNYALKELEQAMRYHSPTFEGDGIRGSVALNKMDSMTNKVIELKAEIKALNAEYVRVKKELLGVFMKVGEKNQLIATVLISRYINFKSIKKIMKEVHYSRTRVYDFLAKGADMVKEIVDE